MEWGTEVNQVETDSSNWFVAKNPNSCMLKTNYSVNLPPCSLRTNCVQWCACKAYWLPSKS